MSGKSKTAIITFLGNAYHDSRVVNLIDSLENVNVHTTTISFDWKTKNFKSQFGQTSIYKLEKSKSSINYYFKFVFYLVRDLLKYNADFYFAEDIYTLPITYFFAKLNKAKVFYNSREIYAHLAGLRNKGFTQRVITRIENTFIRKVDLVLVTGEMDAEYLKEAYQINNFCVLRNLPKYTTNISKIDLRDKLNIPKNSKIILYQGVLLEGRGISKVMNILGNFPHIYFVIVGEGEFRQKFETHSNSLEWSDRIHFLGAVNHNELLSYTASADIGLTLIENISISYYYALPNKLFEYIMAGVPVLASNLPQMKKIIDDYGVGKYVDLEKEEEVEKTLGEMITEENRLNDFRTNCQIAAKELNWDVEFEKLKEYLLN